MRDDFTTSTKETLAKRVHFLCSNPDCQLATVGPHSEVDKVVNKGVAAHITAASPGGKRYDPSLTSKQRSCIENAIWLCQNCAKLIDNDESRFTTELLREWKLVAESRVARSIRANRPVGLSVTQTNKSLTANTEDETTWLRDNIHTANLRESLPRALQFAKSAGLSDLERWVRLELYGYKRDGGMTDEDVVPEYRTVTGRWMDEYDRMLDISHDPDLAFINQYRFRFGVGELEPLAACEEMQNLADEHLINVLRKEMGVRVVRFCFSPIELRGVLNHIRNRLAEMVLDAINKTGNAV